MKKLLVENQIIKTIAKDLNLDERTVMLVIKSFFRSVRKQLSLNNEINIKGFFKIVMVNSYKKQFKKNNKYNPRKRVQYLDKIKNKVIDNNEEKDNINH